MRRWSDLPPVEDRPDANEFCRDRDFASGIPPADTAAARGLAAVRAAVEEHQALERPPSLTDTVVMFVRDRVINGDYAPGQRLAEAGLAKSLGTSRGTVREAMRVLASVGLVSKRGNRGPIVTALNPARAREIYTLRALLESFAARTAAELGRFDEHAMADLRMKQEALADAAHGSDIRTMVDADMQLHMSISAVAGNLLLLEHLTSLHTHARRLLVYSDYYRPDAGAIVTRHEMLLDVVRGGDPDVIERAVRDHIVGVGMDVEGKMQVTPDASSVVYIAGGNSNGGAAH